MLIIETLEIDTRMVTGKPLGRNGRIFRGNLRSEGFFSNTLGTVLQWLGKQGCDIPAISDWGWRRFRNPDASSGLWNYRGLAKHAGTHQQGSKYHGTEDQNYGYEFVHGHEGMKKYLGTFKFISPFVAPFFLPTFALPISWYFLPIGHKNNYAILRQEAA